MNRTLWLAGVAGVLALATLGGTHAHAQTTFAANDGDWSNAANWNNGVPINTTWAAIDDHTISVTPGAAVGLLDVGLATGKTGTLTVAPGNDLATGNAGGIRL